MKIGKSLEGEGKYDQECQQAFESCQAEGILLIVINGRLGHGFSAVLNHRLTMLVPTLLRKVADEIEKGIKTAAKS